MIQFRRRYAPLALAIALAAFTLSARPSIAADLAGSRPNIVIILTDDKY